MNLLDVLDVLQVLGLRVGRDEWRWRFRPEATAESSLRAWERFKATVREHRVPARFEATPGLADVLVFEAGAHAAIERLLPPIEADDPDELERQDDAPAPRRPRRVSAAELEGHARAVWASAMFATAGVLHRELARQRPDVWAARERRAHDLFRRLEQEDRDREHGVRLTATEAELVAALREGPAATSRELLARLAARSPAWASRSPVTVRVYIGRLRERLRDGPLRVSELRYALMAGA